MVHRTRPWIGVALLCALVAAGAWALHHSHHHRPLRPGEPLPTLAVVALNGASVRLDPPQSGTVVYNVFTTWCPSCREETPALARAAAALQKRGVRFVGIDQGEGPSAVSAFASANNIGYPILLDTDRQTNALFGARVIPETIVVHDGIVRSISVGPVDVPTLTRLVDTSESATHA